MPESPIVNPPSAVSGRQSRHDTIAAISTPPGEGGIGIIRISGALSLDIAQRVFRQPDGISAGSGHRRVKHGFITDADGETLDEVLLHVMRAPRSYTREDVVEINCHGGAGPVQCVLDRVLECGARLAHPGEFTRRAFLNGRIDLVQAESVIDRIRARTRAGLQAAAASARGDLSIRIHQFTDILRGVLARVEAAVDFPEEDLPDFVTPEMESEVTAVRDEMRVLLDNAEAGRLYREGACMVISGLPNVGKSSLFNALLRDSRAIVTAIPGTTRDRLEETISLNGIPVRLVDTAGIRDAGDEVEQAGVALAREAMREAAVVLLVIDGSAPSSSAEDELVAELLALHLPVWVAVNKSDLPANRAFILDSSAGVSHISVQTGTGLHELEAGLAGLLLGGHGVAPSDCLLSRAHQRDSLRRAELAVSRFLATFGASPEFLSVEIRDALAALGEITGETTPDAVLDDIFGRFCIGK